MILGNESKLLDFLKTKDNPHYEGDISLSKQLDISISSLKSYRNKLKKHGLIECKQVFKGNVKVIAYQMKEGKKQ